MTTHYLAGSEEVSRAASTMRTAADDMTRAASSISSAMHDASSLMWRLEQAVALFADSVARLERLKS